eukprot:scaffold276935_cov39-Prasinocladus_malaysianus.AAC.1
MERRLGMFAGLQFQEAVKAAVAVTSKRFEARLSRDLREGIPLAKAIPVIVAVGNAIMDECTESSKQISQLRDVGGLCASIYSNGPPL